MTLNNTAGVMTRWWKHPKRIKYLPQVDQVDQWYVLVTHGGNLLLVSHLPTQIDGMDGHHHAHWLDGWDVRPPMAPEAPSTYMMGCPPWRDTAGGHPIPIVPHATSSDVASWWAMMGSFLRRADLWKEECVEAFFQRRTHSAFLRNTAWTQLNSSPFAFHLHATNATRIPFPPLSKWVSFGEDVGYGDGDDVPAMSANVALAPPRLPLNPFPLARHPRRWAGTFVSPPTESVVGLSSHG